MDFPESDPQEFERLAIRNGDVGYNRWLEFWEYPLLLPIIFRQCILPAMPTGMKSIRRGHCWTISCGPNFGPTPIISVADTKTGGGNNVQMLVEDLKADDMQMIRDYVIIYFTKTPTIDPIHTLTVEWTTVEGGGQDRLAHLPAAGQCERITCVQSRTI